MSLTRILVCSFADPAHNLALEEALLYEVDAGRSPATLRIWESSRPFVVLGCGQRAAEEIFLEHCCEDGVPVLRRCTGGGCVLQGPGCVNFTIAVPLRQVPQWANVRASYRDILGRLSNVLNHEFGCRTHCAEPSDLCVGDRKISGNAQRRTRATMLHHGTLLWHVDYAALHRYIKEPRQRPEYRGHRTHDEFVTTLPITSTQMVAVFRRAFAPQGVEGTLTSEEEELTHRLAQQKYSQDTWTYRR
jgi:lipoate-protein ligase A